jgi:two-component system chemotaxis response regulator CheY
MRAFVIDDHEFSQDLAKRVLATMGIADTRQYADAGEALEQMPELQPDLVLVDFEMTPMSGVEFVRRVRSAKTAWSGVPILMITGHTSPDHVRQAAAAGVDGFVVKPFSLNSMRARVEKVMKARGSVELEA